MSITAAEVAQPDAEAHVVAQLAPLPGVTCFTYAAQRDWPGWLVAYSVQVDARAGTKSAACALAERARRAMAALPAAPWPEGVISYVQPLEGPFWLPDPEDGKPRYTARYEVRAHPHPPRPGAPAGTPPAGAAPRQTGRKHR